MTSQLYDTVLEKMREFLRLELPQHSGNWIEKTVEPYLNSKHIGFSSKPASDVLSELDLADTLRVAERNWGKIACHHQFPRQLFGVIKHLQLSRDAYAHRSTDTLDFQWESYDILAADILFRYLKSAMSDLAA